MALSLKRQTLTLYYAVRDPRTPWTAKLVAGCVVAYAISPIDPIPDFIPVLGYLDEVIILPARETGSRSNSSPVRFWMRLDRRWTLASERPTAKVAAAIVVLIWVTAVIVFGRWAYSEWISS
jgi:hypothetical protein